MYSRLVLIVGISLIFFSCLPQIHVTKTTFKTYPAREEGDSVVIYNNQKDMPINSERIGGLEVSCTKWMENCDYTSVLSIAEPKIKRIGGNALLITEYEKPSFWNYDKFLLKGAVYLVHDFSSPPDTTLSFGEKHLYGGIGFGPETVISAPKISYYNFQYRKFLETYYGAEVGIWFIHRPWISLDGLYGVKKNLFTFDASLGGWYAPSIGYPEPKPYFHTTVNPKVGIKFWKLWLKAGPSFYLHRYSPKGEEPMDIARIGNRYYNFEILVKF